MDLIITRLDEHTHSELLQMNKRTQFIFKVHGVVFD